MIDTKRKEVLSLSYMEALCAIRGIAVETHKHDDDGIDAHLSKTITRKDGYKFIAQINVQLKASSAQYKEYEYHYTYPLKKKAFDDLRLPATAKPYLFLLILPQDEKEWVLHSIDELIIKRCMFWLDLANMPSNENTSSVTVSIPKINVVSPEALEEFLIDVADRI